MQSQRFLSILLLAIISIAVVPANAWHECHAHDMELAEEGNEQECEICDYTFSNAVASESIEVISSFTNVGPVLSYLIVSKYAQTLIQLRGRAPPTC